MKEYYVYIMSNSGGTLYVGMTNDLTRRVYEHKQELAPGFTKRYKLHSLVYYESCNDVDVAISREKQLKRYLRQWKLDLIASMNPEFEDLYYRILGSSPSMTEEAALNRTFWGE